MKTSWCMFLFTIVTLGAFNQAQAGIGTSLMQTAPVKGVGEFELKFQGDIIFNRGGGFNLSPHFVTGFVDHYFDVDTFIGAGTTDLQVGALVKFNFLPDLPGQVGLSFLGGFSYLRDEEENAGLLTLGVLTSKKFNAEFGDITPYAAFEYETLFAEGDASVPLTLLFGSKWEPSGTVPWGLYSELSLSLRKSLFMLSLGASYPF